MSATHPSTREFYRYTDLRARGIVNNRVTLCRWIAAGYFPAGFRLTPGGRHVWRAAEVDALLEQRSRPDRKNTA
jgi:hypothetical protein